MVSNHFMGRWSADHVVVDGCIFGLNLPMCECVQFRDFVWLLIGMQIPVQASWNKNIRGAKCQDIRASALGTGIANVIL